MHLPLPAPPTTPSSTRTSSRLLRRAAVTASAAALTLAGLAAGAPATAATAPAPRTFTAPIEPWPTPWTSEKGCDSTVKPGPSKLSDLIAATWGTFGGFGTDRTCHATSEDGHDDYRAVDWMATSTNATSKAAAESFIAWLTGPDGQGDPAAMARRLGVMYVIWNNRMWRSYPHNGNPAGSWETYLSCGSSSWATPDHDTICHRNHVHVSLTPDGAWARTSYWSGTTTTSSSGSSSTSAGTYRAVLPLGDVDHDGRGDLMVEAGDGAMWYRAGGESGFAPPVRVGQGWNVMTAVLDGGDYTGDGATDVIARDSAGTLWMYPGDGRGGFTGTRTAIGSRGWQVMSALTAGDLDGDGRPDVVARDSQGSLWLYPNHGYLTGPQRIGTGWNGMDDLVIEDFTGDGKPDVLARAVSTGDLYLYQGDGAAHLRGVGRIGTGWNVMNLITGGGGADGSGRTGVLARDTSGTLWFYPGTGHGTFVGSRADLGTGW